MASISVTPLSKDSSIGAEISGVDLAQISCYSNDEQEQPRRQGVHHDDDENDKNDKNVNDNDSQVLWDTIYEAFLKYGVLVFRNQHSLSPDRYLQVAKQFGEVSDYPFAKGMEGFPGAITEIIKEPHQTSNFGGMWHSDTTYLDKPPKCTLLYAVETPPLGMGDTLFADMYRAYETLSEDVKEKLRGRLVIQSSSLNAAVLRGNHLESGSMKEKDISSSSDISPSSSSSSSYQASHPAVRTHPETQQKALFVNPSHSCRFEDQQTQEESKVLLEQLFKHSVQPEFTIRISWEPGTMVVWDNRCLVHCAINDYNGHRRVMRRITIAGDVPY
jgi:taurine dioxygenase